jgi:hypothetical protein
MAVAARSDSCGRCGYGHVGSQAGARQAGSTDGQETKKRTVEAVTVKDGGSSEQGCDLKQLSSSSSCGRWARAFGRRSDGTGVRSSEEGVEISKG